MNWFSENTSIKYFEGLEVSSSFRSTLSGICKNWIYTRFWLNHSVHIMAESSGIILFVQFREPHFCIVVFPNICIIYDPGLSYVTAKIYLRA